MKVREFFAALGLARRQVKELEKQATWREPKNKYQAVGAKAVEDGIEVRVMAVGMAAPGYYYPVVGRLSKEDARSLSAFLTQWSAD